MTTKTHQRRRRAGRRHIAARMRAVGLDPNNHADRMQWLFQLRERIAAARPKTPT